MVCQPVPLQPSFPSELGCRVYATLKEMCPGDWDTNPVAKGWLVSS